ncbi:MAG: putative CRISPR-associated protein [Candidatus Korarchaeum sp.]
MSEVHVITCGASLLTNFSRSTSVEDFLQRYSNLKDLGDPSKNEKFLRELSKEEREILKGAILQYLRQDPRRASAEMNSLFGYIEDVRKEDVLNIKNLISEIHLIRSDTEVGRLAADVLYEYLNSLGLNVSVHVVSGFGSGDFDLAIENLVNKVRGIVKFSGDKLVFNLTGGYKPEVAAMAVLAAENDIEQYYIHEASKKTVTLPSISKLKVRMTKWEKLLMVLATLMNFPLNMDPLEMGLKLTLTAAIVWIAYKRV